MAPCGLPVSYAGFTSASTITTFNMTADCYFNSSAVQTGWPFLRFESGAFTINGNGFSIIGPSNGYAIIVGLPTADTTAVLDLNNVTIRDAGRANAFNQAVIVQRGARLNSRNIIFRNNVGAGGAISAIRGGKAYLENVEFLNNRKTYGTVGAGIVASVQGEGRPAADTVLSITGGIFEGNNTVLSNDIVISVVGGTLQLQDCIIFRSNQGSNYRTSVAYGINGIVMDNSSNQGNRSRCPSKRKREEKAPTPTATPRPQIAATHVALQAATGATFRTTFGLDSGVHFRQLDGAGIGVQSIIDTGFLEAFDVYGYVEQGVEVCFPQIGRVIFLDANTSPRAITALESTVVNGQTCVSINSPGSLVLLPG